MIWKQRGQACSGAAGSSRAATYAWARAVTHLVRVLHVHTEAQLLQDPPLSFDDLIFGINVVLIKYQWTWSPGL